MRGTPFPFAGRWPCSGIIPAYAGNTGRVQVCAICVGDHPRVCGEHDPPVNGSDSFVGSSPRMRGTHDIPIPHIPRDGIIPAYAGNTHAVVPSPCCARDHPRVCGEHFAQGFGDIDQLGSSPRMRGTLAYFRIEGRYYGIIPAYAGNTYAAIGKTTIWWDHPRVCGEHLLSPVAPLAYAGSSPRMRGTLDGVDRLAGSEGIIPAYAGNTWTIRPARPPRRDHPRVCGEHPSDGE